VSAMLTMLATVATLVFLPTVTAIVPMVIWLTVVTVVEWHKHEGRHAARRRRVREEEGC
jgi:uncharacterized Tic20 family protein